MAFWNYRSDTENPENGILQIDGVLEVEPDWWGPSGQVIARTIRRSIDRARDLTVYINSPGGDVMAGAEIYTALREHSENGQGKVTVKVTGIAASAASIVAMAGDEILMSPVAYMMIHNPWTVTAGNAKELRQQADVLDTISEGLVNAYERRTGKTREELLQMLDGETYMSAQTCINEGFADGMMWETPAKPDPLDNRTQPAAAMMQSRNYGRQAVMARLRDHGATIPNPKPPEAEETAKRAEIAKRAAYIAALFN